MTINDNQTKLKVTLFTLCRKNYEDNINYIINDMYCCDFFKSQQRFVELFLYHIGERYFSQTIPDEFNKFMKNDSNMFYMMYHHGKDKKIKFLKIKELWFKLFGFRKSKMNYFQFKFLINASFLHIVQNYVDFLISFINDKSIKAHNKQLFYTQNIDFIFNIFDSVGKGHYSSLFINSVLQQLIPSIDDKAFSLNMKKKYSEYLGFHTLKMIEYHTKE